MHRFHLFISHLIPKGMMPQLFHPSDQKDSGAAPGASCPKASWKPVTVCLRWATSTNARGAPPGHIPGGELSRGECGCWEAHVSALLSALLPWRRRRKDGMGEGDFRKHPPRAGLPGKHGPHLLGRLRIGGRHRSPGLERKYREALPTWSRSLRGTSRLSPCCLVGADLGRSVPRSPLHLQGRARALRFRGASS